MWQGGEYIAFADADDFIDPVMYEELYKTAVGRQAKIVRCGAVQFDSDSGRIIRHRRECNVFKEITSTGKLLKAYFEKNIDRVVWNGIYHRSLFKTVRFPVGKEYEDQYVTPALLAQTNKYIYLPVSYYYYRKHPEAFTLSESVLADSKADKVQSLNTLYRIIQECNLEEELSFHYSQYFYFMIFNYHNPAIYSYPGYLRKNRKSIDNLIMPEAFEYVLEKNHLDQRERFFMQLMRRSHFLLFPVQKLARVWDMIFGRKTETDITSKRKKIDPPQDNKNYEKIILLYG